MSSPLSIFQPHLHLHHDGQIVGCLETFGAPSTAYPALASKTWRNSCFKPRQAITRRGGRPQKGKQYRSVVSAACRPESNLAGCTIRWGHRLVCGAIRNKARSSYEPDLCRDGSMPLLGSPQTCFAKTTESLPKSQSNPSELSIGAPKDFAPRLIPCGNPGKSTESLLKCQANPSELLIGAHRDFALPLRKPVEVDAVLPRSQANPSDFVDRVHRDLALPLFRSSLVETSRSRRNVFQVLSEP